MKLTLAQIQIRTADFKYNCEQIFNVAKKIKSDLIIFPNLDLEKTSSKGLLADDFCIRKHEEFLQNLAAQNFSSPILVGDILIKNGQILKPVGGFFEIAGKKIFVSNEFKTDIKCDLYILAQNTYFTLEEKLAENIETSTDFVYINSVGLADENVFYGASFAKNKNNELVAEFAVAKEEIAEIDFSKRIKSTRKCQQADIFAVLTFALKEYCAITGFKKVILGLSGGIDSALTAALTVAALGKENFLGILMPSMFSSEGSVKDAEKLAENLGIKTETLPITQLFENFMKNHERKHDLAEENLQARLRALILMFFSNRDGYLLLSTGNKSESAMGYGTLYGDLCGGLNLIADLTKTRVYELANWINRDKKIIPQEIIDKAPSAELRPNQKDQDSLPEYAVLDDIIEMYIEQNLPQEEIYKKYDKTLVDDTIKRIYRAQFKRKQCGLGIRLTERSFCANVNLPILQGLY